MNIKKLAPYIAGALVLFLAGYLIATANGKAAVAETKAKAEEEKAALLETQIHGYQDQIAQSAAAYAKLEADAAMNERLFLTQLAVVKTATPQQLVDQGSQITGYKDITTDGRIVTMGIETYRAFVTIAVDWKQYKDVREPSWLKEKGLLNDQLAAFKASAALQAQKDAALAASIADLKTYISHQKLSGTLEKVLWAAAGVGAGLVAGKLLK